MRMMNTFAATWIAAMLASGALAQEGAGSAATSGAKEPIVMTGCVSTDASTRELTFTDAKDGTKYKLTGTKADKYAGQRVQIVGAFETRRLRIVGGLSPSPNVAAQAGDIDPARAAVAAAPGGGATGTGSPRLPEFRVSKVSAVAGECPE